MNIFMLTLYQRFIPDDSDARYQQTARNIKRCVYQRQYPTNPNQQRQHQTNTGQQFITRTEPNCQGDRHGEQCVVRRKPRIIQICCARLNAHQLKWSQTFRLIERSDRLGYHVRRQACHQHSGICLIFFVVRHFAQQCVRTNQDYRYNQTVCHQFHNCFHAIIVSSASLHIQSLQHAMFCSTIKYALGIGQVVRQRVLVP